MFDTFNYSIDMIRLYTEVNYYKLQETLDKLVYNPYCKYREMKQINAYMHNFYISGSLPNENEFIEIGYDNYDNEYQVSKENSYSFWLGARHNSKYISRDRVDVVVQFNPNKCQGSEILEYILQNLFSENSFTRVKDIDFAIDIPYNIRDICLKRDLKSGYRLIDNGGDDITHYMRKRGSHGHLKLYNKAREQKKSGNLTRYEITLKIDVDLKYISDYVIDMGIFPNIYIMAIDKQLDVSQELPIGVDKVLTMACMENPGYLKELPFRRRKKIESFLETLFHKVDFTDCQNIKNTIYEYFNNLKQHLDIK